ncbi:hypothetical protein CEXT_309541, partial [Caerostris extrusa]
MWLLFAGSISGTGGRERRKLALRNSSAPHRHFVIVLTLP